MPGDELYLRAFSHLESERSTGMGIGPIPYGKIVWYFERQGMSGDLLDCSVEVVREMDAGYLAFKSEEMRARMPKEGR